MMPDHPRLPDHDLPDADLLLELAAWADGTLPPDRVAGLEGRLARDPQARALAASVRLRPVTPPESEAPVPAEILARAAALVPTRAVAPTRGRVRAAEAVRAHDPPSDGVEVELVRGPFRFAPLLRVAAGLAACVGAAAVGWQLGGSAGRPMSASAARAAAGAGASVGTGAAVAEASPSDRSSIAVPRGESETFETDTLLAAASFGVFDADDDDPLQFLLAVDATVGGTVR